MYPRAKAFGIALHNERILVQEYTAESETYYRPLGGSIAFGEKSAETIIREWKEELGVQVEVMDYLGRLENMFHGGHEIEMIPIRDEEPNAYAKWIPIIAFLGQEKVLYPNGLIELLAIKIKDGIL
ncbi:DNA mismatch repair protein MutT [Bacillus cereus]|uniref:DNA mismatch repair protein MutT n=1 Tax=Bacillus cereus TaxID=1396 RepID=A0A2B0LUX1_BACCE|nr:DNA mismatch repair protein MutT [Bacillus cereus]